MEDRKTEEKRERRGTDDGWRVIDEEKEVQG